MYIVRYIYMLPWPYIHTSRPSSGVVIMRYRPEESRKEFQGGHQLDPLHLVQVGSMQWGPDTSDTAVQCLDIVILGPSTQLLTTSISQ